MKLSDKAYNILKSIALYIIPPIATLCFAVAQVWGLPYGEEISASVSAVGTALAGIIGASSVGYNTVGEDNEGEVE